MPLYEYKCQACGSDMEILQKFSDPVKRKCPKCGGHLKKLMSESAFHLKGSGWYKTDYSAPASKSENGDKSEKKEEKKETKEAKKEPEKPKEKSEKKDVK